jgi:hypothetical protein
VKYRKKPVIIEAIQFTGDNFDDIKKTFPDLKAKMVGGFLIIPTLEGDMKAVTTDFIIKGTAGEFYPCKSPIFYNLYEEMK